MKQFIISKFKVKYYFFSIFEISGLNQVEKQHIETLDQLF